MEKAKMTREDVEYLLQERNEEIKSNIAELISNHLPDHQVTQFKHEFPGVVNDRATGACFWVYIPGVGWVEVCPVFAPPHEP